MKHMKRSMFITTIMMVVVLVVALSTATFAWYTAQSNAASTNTTLTAASSSSASLGLDTANNGANSTYSSVTLTLSGTVAPMVPNAAPVIKDGEITPATTYSSFTGSFVTAPVDNAGNFTGAGSTVSPATIASAQVTSSAVTQNNFYVVNTNGTNASEVDVAVNIVTTGYTLLASAPADFTANFANYYTRSGHNTVESPYVYTAMGAAATFATDTYYAKNDRISDKLRVAVFADDAYLGTWGAGDIHYGAIANGANGTTSLSTYETTANQKASASAVNMGSIAALGAKKISIAAWFEGTSLVVADSSLNAVFNISFAIHTNTEG